MKGHAETLRGLAAALRGGSPLLPVVNQALRIPAPEGDPEVIRDAAHDFRRSARALDDAGVDLARLRRNALPTVWPRGRDATTAEDRMVLTERHAERSGEVMAAISGCLIRLADHLSGARVQDATARQEIQSAVSLAQTSEPDQLGSVVEMLAAAIDKLADAAERAERAGFEAARSLNEHAAAASAAQLDTTSLSATDRLLLTGAADGLGPVLAHTDAARAAAALDAMSAADRQAFFTLLAAAGSDVERAWLLKALAAGNSLVATTAFAEAIHGRTAAWLQSRLRPLDPDRWIDPGTGQRVPEWMGAVLAQSTDTTCGSMSLMLTRAIHDPVYALGLATGDGSMAARLAAEEQRIQQETNRLRVEGFQVKWWPSFLGTAPGYAAEWLTDTTGVEHQVSFAATTGSGDGMSGDVAGSVAHASAGSPSLLLIGNNLHPDHYVMVIGQDDAGVLVYNPWGVVETIPAGNLHREPLDELRRPRLWAVITAAG